MATIDARAARLNLAANVGDDLSLTFTVTESAVAYNWTGATVDAAIYPNGSTTAVVTTFTLATPVNGTLTAVLSDANTTTLGVGVFQYRIRVTKSGLTQTWVAGNLTVGNGPGGSTSTTATLTLSSTAATITVTPIVDPGPAVANTDTIYVSTAGSDSNTGGSWGTAKLTIEAAYAALPSTGGRMELSGGTFTLAASGATTGLTVTNSKPVGIRGAGRSLTTIAYGGTGIAVAVGTGASFLDWGYLEDVTINCTNNAAATTGLFLNNCHRGYLNRAGVISAGNTAGSTGVLGTTAFQNYISDSLIYGFEDAVDLTANGNDFGIFNTSIDATGVCVRLLDCHNTRLEGGQISGQSATTIGVQIDSNVASASYGNQILNVHFEGTLLDVKIGAAATSSQIVMSPVVMCPMPSGISMDKVMQPFVQTSLVGAGKTITLTSNVTSGVLVYALNGGTLSDSGATTTKLTTAATGALFAATMVLTGQGTAVNFKATNGAPAYDFNPSAASGTYLRSIVAAEANERFSLTFSGQLAWGAGGASGTDLTISRKGAGALAIGGAIAPLVARQTLAANGAVNFDPRYGQVYIETLNANATSSTISGGTGPSDGQHMTIVWKQDATGGRTYVWPTNCKFASNTAPSDTTLSTQTTVTFVWDNTAARWIEISRSVAVPVA